MSPRQVVPGLVELRRHLHAHAELSMQETETASAIEGWLGLLGLSPKRIAGTGVTATVSGKKRGKTIVARADIDGLPVTEQTGLPFASQNDGVMHACGHDVHAAGLVEVARRFAAEPPERGAVKLLFQPGEEGANGMGQCIDAGLLKRPVVHAAVGVHVWSPEKVGRIALREGPTMAAIDTFEVHVHGRGGHAAYPHDSVDPIVVAAHVVTALQTIVSRSVDPRDSAVVTVGSLQAGTAFNVIPPHAVLRGTVRTFDDAVRKRVGRRFKRLVTDVSRGLGARAEIEWTRFLPSLLNDPGMVELAREVAVGIVGKKNVVHCRPTMGSEDMSLLLREVPGVFGFIGGSDGTPRTSFPHHHPQFDVHEDALAIGAAFIEGVVRRYLEVS